ncbi:hypothetical protein DAEQUDRAFT_381906 [Daedalea quercina L-15889]|uniref:Secreted protein n=1 Tax=Daedalea quercina L-15889 TaxID=1314783 RepID=A0A165NZZ9_9APHY|nr:hypothetical protein DAEQUDRAFT_381906 [Daedalea quercina L-15889]
MLAALLSLAVPVSYSITPRECSKHLWTRAETEMRWTPWRILPGMLRHNETEKENVWQMAFLSMQAIIIHVDCYLGCMNDAFWFMKPCRN